MSVKCRDIMWLMEDLAPSSYAEEWDNPGLNVGDAEADVKKILVALDATEAGIGEAIGKGADMIATQHPLLYQKEKKINYDRPDGRKIIRLIECEMGDEFHTGNDEFTFIWLFPGTGAFAFDSGTNFMMGNDFMYVDGGRYIKFDDFLTDSKFIMLIVDKAGFADFFCMHSYSFVSCDDIHRLLDSVSSDSPYLVHYPASRRLIRAADLIISDFNDITNPRELAVIDTMRFFNSLANLSDKEYGPLTPPAKNIRRCMR